MPTSTGLPSGSDGPFERFLTAALAAIITIMFSWRLLTEEVEDGTPGSTSGAVRTPTQFSAVGSSSTSGTVRTPTQVSAVSSSNTQSMSSVQNKTIHNFFSNTDSHDDIDSGEMIESRDKSSTSDANFVEQEFVSCDSFKPEQKSPFEAKIETKSDEKLSMPGLSETNNNLTSETLTTWDEYKWEEETGEDEHFVIKTRRSPRFLARNFEALSNVHTNSDRQRPHHLNDVPETFHSNTDVDATSAASNVSSPSSLSSVSFSQRFANFEYNDAGGDSGYIDLYPDTESDEDTNSSGSEHMYEINDSDSDSDLEEDSGAEFYGVKALDTIEEEQENNECENDDEFVRAEENGSYDSFSNESIRKMDILHSSTHQEKSPLIREHMDLILEQPVNKGVTKNDSVNIANSQSVCSSVSETLSNLNSSEINKVCQSQHDKTFHEIRRSENVECDSLPDRVLPLNEKSNSQILSDSVFSSSGTAFDVNTIDQISDSSKSESLSLHACVEKKSKHIELVTEKATTFHEISQCTHSSSLVRTCALDSLDGPCSDTESCSNESVTTVVSVKSNDSDNHKFDVKCDNFQNNILHISNNNLAQDDSDDRSLIFDQNNERLSKYEHYSLVSGFLNDSLNSLLSGKTDSSEQLSDADSCSSGRENIGEGSVTRDKNSIEIKEGVLMNGKSTSEESCVSSSESLPFVNEIIQQNDEISVQENVNDHNSCWIESTNGTIGNSEQLNDIESSHSDSSSDSSDPPLREYDPEDDDLADFQFNLDYDDDSFYLVMCNEAEGRLRTFDTCTNLNSVGLSSEYRDAVTSHTASDDAHSFKFSQTECIDTTFRKRLYLTDRTSQSHSETLLSTVSFKDEEGTFRESERTSSEPLIVERNTLPLKFVPSVYNDADISTLNFANINVESTKSVVNFQANVIQGDDASTTIEDMLYPAEEQLHNTQFLNEIDVITDISSKQASEIDTLNEDAINQDTREINYSESTSKPLETENVHTASDDKVLLEEVIHLEVIQEEINQNTTPTTACYTKYGLVEDGFEINRDTHYVVNGTDLHDYEREKRPQHFTPDNSNKMENSIGIVLEDVSHDASNSSSVNSGPEMETNIDDVFSDKSNLENRDAFSINERQSKRNNFDKDSLYSATSAQFKIETTFDELGDSTWVLPSKKFPVYSAPFKADLILSCEQNINDIATDKHNEKIQALSDVMQGGQKTDNSVQFEHGTVVNDAAKEQQEFSAGSDRPESDNTMSVSYRAFVTGLFQDSESAQNGPKDNADKTFNSESGIVTDKIKQLPLSNCCSEIIVHSNNIQLNNQSDIWESENGVDHLRQDGIIHDNNKCEKNKSFDMDQYEENILKTYHTGSYVMGDDQEIRALSDVNDKNNNRFTNNSHVENQHLKPTENGSNCVENKPTMESLHNADTFKLECTRNTLNSQQMNFKDHNENITLPKAENLNNTHVDPSPVSPQQKSTYNSTRVLRDDHLPDDISLSNLHNKNGFNEQCVIPHAYIQQNMVSNGCDTNDTQLKNVRENVNEKTEEELILIENLNSLRSRSLTADDEFSICSNSLQASTKSSKDLNKYSFGRVIRTPLAKPSELLLKSNELKGVKKKVQRRQMKKYSSILQQPVTLETTHNFVEATVRLPSAARRQVLKSRERFFSSENLACGFSGENFEDKFLQHRTSLMSSAPRKYLKRHERQLQSTESLPASISDLNTSYGSNADMNQMFLVKSRPSPRHIEDFAASRYSSANSSFERGHYEKLHANCIFSLAKREQIRQTTKSLENMIENLQYGSISSFVETNLNSDVKDIAHTQSFQDTDINDILSFQFSLKRAASMSALTSSSDSNKLSRKHEKGRFANRNVPKSKSLLTLETNLDDVFANEFERPGELKKTPSVHELRVVKSLSKLHVPDWFKKSSFSRSDSTQSLFTYAGKLGSTSTLASTTYVPSIPTSPCPSVTPVSNTVIIQKRVTPSQAATYARLPRTHVLPTTPEKAPIHPTKQSVCLPSDKFRKKKEEKELKQISIIPFAKLREMFEKKSQVESKSQPHAAASPTQEKPLAVKLEPTPRITLAGYPKSSHDPIITDTDLSEKKSVQNERTVSPPPLVSERKTFLTDDTRHGEIKALRKHNEVHFSDVKQAGRSEEQNSYPVHQNGTVSNKNSTNVKKPQSLRTSLPMPQFRFRRPGSYATKVVASAQNSSSQNKRETTV